MWPPFQPDRPPRTPMLDTGLVLAGALTLALVAAVNGSLTWLVASGAVAIVALIYLAYLENR